MKRDDTPWPDEQVALLTKFWAEGLSAGEIAKRVGLPKRSRNAVIGKVHRLGLPQRATPYSGGYVRRPRAARLRAAPSAPKSPRIAYFKRVEIKAPEPNKFDASPGSQIAHALLSAAASAEHRRDMYRGVR